MLISLIKKLKLASNSLKFNSARFSPWLLINGINIAAVPNRILSNNSIVTTTAIVFLNFSLRLKKMVIGLPIKETTPEIAIYTNTELILKRNNNSKAMPIIIPKALSMPLLISFVFDEFNWCCLVVS